MRTIITHENFDSVIDRCKKGLTRIALFTAYKTTVIEGKHLQKFEKAGYNLLAKDTQSKGFYIMRGKNRDYIYDPKFGAMLYEIF